jgi:hypothetical protein
VIRRFLGPSPVSRLGAAVVLAALGFGLVYVVYEELVLMDVKQGLRRAEYRVDELERATEKVGVARGYLDRVRQETEDYRQNIRRMQRIMPEAIDVEATAAAIRERLEAVSLSVSVELEEEARNRDFYYEYDFELRLGEATREELFRAVDLIHRGLPLRSVTHANLPYDASEAFPASLTVTSYVYRTE